MLSTGRYLGPCTREIFGSTYPRGKKKICILAGLTTDSVSDPWSRTHGGAVFLLITLELKSMKFKWEIDHSEGMR